MELLTFLHGESAKLPVVKTAGTVYICEDNGAMYVDLQVGDSIKRISITDPEIVAKLAALEEASEGFALTTDVEALFANYRTAAAQTEIDTAQDNRVKVIEDDYVVAADIANFETKANVAQVAADLNAAIALKADKSAVDAMYTNEQIDEFIKDAKDYAAGLDDADTKYGIAYDSDTKKITLVEGGTNLEIDATDFIKDGMIENVAIGDDNDLVITFNTDAGKQDIKLPLDQLVDIYTGNEGARVVVTVAADKSISADLVAGSIAKNYLDVNVQESLDKADTALQEHQNISHLATTADMNTALETKADKTAVETALNNKANVADVYAKTETFTREEVAAAINAALEAALAWGTFPTSTGE